MIDAGCARLDRSSCRDNDRREQMKLHRRWDEKSRDDRSEGGVFRHVLRIFLLITIVAVIVRVRMVMVSNHFDAVVMILEPSEHLMRVSHREKQHDEQC
jgi:hypothetical protein